MNICWKMMFFPYPDSANHSAGEMVLRECNSVWCVFLWTYLGGGLKHVFYVHPHLRKWSNLTNIFSDWSKPPTRYFWSWFGALSFFKSLLFHILHGGAWAFISLLRWRSRSLGGAHTVPQKKRFGLFSGGEVAVSFRHGSIFTPSSCTWSYKF